MTRMTTLRTFLTCSIGALVVGAGLAAVPQRGPAPRGWATARSRGATRATAALADQTRRVLVQRDGVGAVALAERLVAAEPHQAAYRALLGQSYLQAGRFASARQAFTDALQLDPADGRSALNLALAMVAGGNGAGARALLDRHASVIPAADLGLALSLAGDPAQGVRILTAAAREQGAASRRGRTWPCRWRWPGNGIWRAWPPRPTWPPPTSRCGCRNGPTSPQPPIQPTKSRRCWASIRYRTAASR
ncbi:tetratricopeptide repeat protein [Sphingomonas sp. I4]